MRAPFQILLIPYRKSKDTYEFAIFRRKIGEYWQWISGGGEDNETLIEAAKREGWEEGNIPLDSKYIPLQSVASIQKDIYPDHSHWPQNIFVIQEHSFAVEIVRIDLKIFEEHLNVRWVTYVEAMSLLKWDSNKTALWELNMRLKANQIDVV